MIRRWQTGFLVSALTMSLNWFKLTHAILLGIASQLHRPKSNPSSHHSVKRTINCTVSNTSLLSTRHIMLE